MTHTPTARRTAATIRAIGIKAHHDHLCARCSVTWNGAEADCWSCGLDVDAGQLLRPSPARSGGRSLMATALL